MMVALPWNLDQAVRLLRDLEHDDKADGLIEKYIEKRGSIPTIFDFTEDSFQHENIITDQYSL
jgi:hypothetical protein